MKGAYAAAAGAVLLFLSWFMLGLGFITSRTFTEQRIRLPDGAIVIITPQQHWDEREGWLSTSTMRDTTSLYVSSDRATEARYDVALVNEGHAYPIPFACQDHGCGGHVEGPQPVAGREVRVCFSPKAGGRSRCGPVAFSYSSSTQPTRWVAMTGI